MLRFSDQNDESLRKWKESLGLGTGNDLSDPTDPRKCIILSLGLEVEGRDDIIIDVSQPGQLEKLKEKPFTIKEGATFRMKVKFRVQHQILSGMKYLQVVKRLKMSQKSQEMIVRCQSTASPDAHTNGNVGFIRSQQSGQAFLREKV
jgi:Rho GDP-dissociation inhibitor